MMKDITEKIDVLIEGKFTWYGSGAKGRPMVTGIDFMKAKNLGYETRVDGKTGYKIWGQFGGKEYMGQAYIDSVDVSIDIPDYLSMATGETDKTGANITVETYEGELNDKHKLIAKNKAIIKNKGDAGKADIIALMKKYAKLAMKEVKNRK
jgi:hypothetical protein